MAIKWKVRTGWKADKNHPLGGEEIIEEINLTPMKAIRKKCLDCCGWQPQEVRLCPNKVCANWPYRMGKRVQDKLEEDK